MDSRRHSFPLHLVFAPLRQRSLLLRELALSAALLALGHEALAQTTPATPVDTTTDFKIDVNQRYCGRSVPYTITLQQTAGNKSTTVFAQSQWITWLQRKSSEMTHEAPRGFCRRRSEMARRSASQTYGGNALRPNNASRRFGETLFSEGRKGFLVNKAEEAPR